MQYTNDYSRVESGGQFLSDFGFKFNSLVWWVDPRGNTHTGVIKDVDCIDGIQWGAARYQLDCGAFITENQHLWNYFPGAAPDFPVQIGQSVWFGSGAVWQAGTVKGLSIILDKWYAEIRFFNGISADYAIKPLGDVRTTAPGLSEDVEYITWLNELVLI